MIGYVTLGTNDLARAGAFYDAVFGILGAYRWKETERLIGWYMGAGQPSICVCMPYDGNAATIGNGMMVAIYASTKETVEAAHAKALEMGGADEGPVGFRASVPGFYVGYFRDPDGNKLNVFCVDKEST